MAEKSRLGGRRTLAKGLHPVQVTGIQIQRLPDMITALQKLRRRREVFSTFTAKDLAVLGKIGTRPVDGNPERLAKAVEASEDLVAEAVFTDPRLARRAQWRRAEEGEYVCPGMLASGDDMPFYKYTRATVNEATQAGEPLRVVVSTDDSQVPEGTAAAFIATARLVQQFVPLEIWWQGSWLDQQKQNGFVTLVPLVQGDIDFSRLEFCISDEWRDAFSFRVTQVFALLEKNMNVAGCGYRAEQDYLSLALGKSRWGDTNMPKFVSHVGISPDPASVASTAAQWLGWEDTWSVKYYQQQAASSAAQEVPAPPEPSKPRTKAEEIAMQVRWAKWEKEAKDKAAAEAANRLATIEA